MKRAVTALLAGGAVFVGATAFAASLGVDSNNLGAGSSDVLACQDATTAPVNVEYNVSYDDTLDGYRVDSIDVTDVLASCVGQLASVTLLDESDGAITEVVDQPLEEGDNNFDLDDADNVTADQVGAVHIVVTNADA